MSNEFDEEGSVVIEVSVPPAATDRSSRETRAFNPKELAEVTGAPWPMAMAALERIDTQARYAFRLGTIALVEELCCEMAAQDASASLVDRLKMLAAMLEKMSWEAP